MVIAWHRQYTPLQAVRFTHACTHRSGILHGASGIATQAKLFTVNAGAIYGCAAAAASWTEWMMASVTRAGIPTMTDRGKEIETKKSMEKTKPKQTLV